eukprot:200836-Chlamydomonas_euryale.AAC.7
MGKHVVKSGRPTSVAHEQGIFGGGMRKDAAVGERMPSALLCNASACQLGLLPARLTLTVRTGAHTPKSPKISGYIAISGCLPAQLWCACDARIRAAPVEQCGP